MGKEIHGLVTFVDAPLDSVWAWVSDPTRFPTLYSSWIRRVKKVQLDEGEAYEGVSWDGDRFEFVPRLDREQGQADFEIAYEDGNVETYRAKLVRNPKGGKPGNTALPHWWEGIDNAFKEGTRPRWGRRRG